MKLCAFVLLLFAMCFPASADTPEGKSFQLAASGAAFYCELSSMVLQAAVAHGNPREEQYSRELSSCISEKGTALIEALKAIPNNPQNKPLRDSAKMVYSAWLAYGGVLLRGVSPDQQQASTEGIAFRKALSDFRTELVLATP